MPRRLKDLTPEEFDQLSDGELNHLHEQEEEHDGDDENYVDYPSSPPDSVSESTCQSPQSSPQRSEPEVSPTRVKLYIGRYQPGTKPKPIIAKQSVGQAATHSPPRIVRNAELKKRIENFLNTTEMQLYIRAKAERYVDDQGGDVYDHVNTVKEQLRSNMLREQRESINLNELN